MNTLNKTARILSALSFLFLIQFAQAQGEKEAAGASASKNQIVIKDFHFTPMTLKVKTGEKISFVNQDEQPAREQTQHAERQQQRKPVGRHSYLR